MDLALIWKTLVIGVIEGLTEFLPVSSTGHIILSEVVLDFKGPPGKVFDIVIQLGAILAVCVLYRAKIWATVVGAMNREPQALRFAGTILVAFLPSAVVGVIAFKYIKQLLESPLVVAVALILGGIAILVIERLVQRPRVKSMDDIDFKTAFWVGVCQCLAMVPGVSRSGATIMGARAFRVDRATAAEFSFFLAMPTMIGAAAYDLYKNWADLSWHGSAVIALGFIAAFFSALVVVGPFVQFISRYGFTAFAWYRIAIGALALVLLLMH
ncbi:MAG: undecaprenyl-diphosphate phosphatase [Alphaproteobacteria bacterium]|nr:undecaprenyl-diphosphate phosphatase [Alphaproteobacteria bacterium]